MYSAAGHRVVEADGSEEVHDKIIFGAHAPDVLRVLGDEATHEELRILGAFQYVQSDMYLHCDESLMAWNSSTWSTCNFLGTTSARELHCFNSAAWLSGLSYLHEH
ncbi:unnamed protein product [Triticum turgidum subsp. durum]|uniref:Uncharacterized protein n=1 Tax=Triticum turgidum subsp. durum TaxID=4567 RepID=A0A9R0V7N7_TRITD|nr:unnamed protein product [Triticum turgidum subsp. durum]